jgi:cytochrome c553
MREFTCTVCRETKEGKKYIYTSSARESKLFVCASCHAITVAQINKKASAILGSSVSTGVLQPEKDKE